MRRGYASLTGLALLLVMSTLANAQQYPGYSMTGASTIKLASLETSMANHWILHVKMKNGTHKPINYNIASGGKVSIGGNEYQALPSSSGFDNKYGLWGSAGCVVNEQAQTIMVPPGTACEFSVKDISIPGIDEHRPPSGNLQMNMFGIKLKMDSY
ncbi:hypothetical protein [Paludibacterium yongneupense]|uniref:hypothetical protein n=1 Tax=Paludibacterium yongneupense TaxID=400061 RepID=UPI000491802C|nr:hypothetical protein [Paludibacterium yongneupense]